MKSKNDYYFKNDIGYIVLRNRKKDISGIALFDIEDTEKVQQHTWHLNNMGYVHSSVYQNSIKIYTLQLHRYIFCCVKNDGIILDHINRNKLDNRKNNLRVADRSLNSFNRKINKNNQLKCSGVFYSKCDKMFRAKITKNKKTISLAYCDTFEEAKQARLKAELKYFGENK